MKKILNYFLLFGVVLLLSIFPITILNRPKWDAPTDEYEKYNKMIKRLMYTALGLIVVGVVGHGIMLIEKD